MTLNNLNYVVFDNPTDAFENLYDTIMYQGVEYQDTKAIFNVGFYISNPNERIITTHWRKFNKKYAEKERKWYLSGNPNGKDISESAKLWKKYMDEEGNIRSNYGRQRQRNGQLDYVIEELKKNSFSRRAVISIYDGKEHETYKFDTPCTCYIQFQILENVLCMTVCMRSNDLIYGFCNDQYQFSKLQELVAEKLSINTGWYFHFATNLHIYDKHFTLKYDNESVYS